MDVMAIQDAAHIIATVERVIELSGQLHHMSTLINHILEVILVFHIHLVNIGLKRKLRPIAQHVNTTVICAII